MYMCVYLCSYAYSRLCSHLSLLHLNLCLSQLSKTSVSSNLSNQQFLSKQPYTYAPITIQSFYICVCVSIYIYAYARSKYISANSIISAIHTLYLTLSTYTLTYIHTKLAFTIHIHTTPFHSSAF
jgi:hypothetical protein